MFTASTEHDSKTISTISNTFENLNGLVMGEFTVFTVEVTQSSSNDWRWSDYSTLNVGHVRMM